MLLDHVAAGSAQQNRRIYDIPMSSSVLVEDEELEDWSSDEADEEVRGVVRSMSQAK